MSEHIENCPGVDLVLTYYSGLLSGEEKEKALEHFSMCSFCSQALIQYCPPSQKKEIKISLAFKRFLAIVSIFISASAFLSLSMRYLGEIQGAIKRIQRDAYHPMDRYSLNTKKKTLHHIAKLFLQIANQYAKVKNLQQATIYIHKALEIYKQTNTKIPQAKLLDKLGILYTKAKKYKKARLYYLQAQEMYRQQGYKNKNVFIIKELERKIKKKN